MTALSSDSPVICLEHRWLYDKSGPVPEDPYYTPLGVGSVVRPGRDVTIVAVSHMVLEALQAAEGLAREGIEAEVIDPRTLRPLDSGLICRSAARTGRLVIADTGWRSYGVSAEIAARAGEELWGVLKAPIRRVALPDVPTPGSSTLEAAYYPGVREIVAAVKQCVETPAAAVTDGVVPSDRKEFEGPF
jgi:pyruvate dehydrogenase E1 component beta subunit